MKKYTFRNYNKDHMARAMGMALPISFKQSVSMSSLIKNQNISSTKKLLQNIMDKKLSVPYKGESLDSRYKHNGQGRYPEKTSKEFIKLIETVEANAQFKGLNTSNLAIVHISAHKASKSWHYGRKSRRRMKRTNIEIVVEEKIKKSQDNKKQSQDNKEKTKE